MKNKTSVVARVILPEDMVEEILVRIPLRSLVNLRRVCKSWDALIFDPQFALKHLDHRKNTDPTSFFLETPLSFVYGILYLFRLNQQPTILCDIRWAPDCWQISELVAGSINGIICLCSWDSRYVALWNPAINHWKPIPLAPRKDGDNLVNTFVGLAFDSITNDYKVIMIVCLSPDIRIQIYSANDDSWIQVNQGFQISEEPTHRRGCSVIVKGVPYWNFKKTKVIAAVDPHTGLYKEIPYPEILNNKIVSVTTFNFMDSLAVLIYSIGETSKKKKFCVYALNETSATWIQIFTTTAPTIMQNKSILIFGCFVHAGKTIVAGLDESPPLSSFLYDVKTDFLCDSTGMEAHHLWASQSCHHVESLVFVHGMKPIQKKEDNNSKRIRNKKKKKKKKKRKINSKRGLRPPMYLGRELGPVL